MVVFLNDFNLLLSGFFEHMTASYIVLFVVFVFIAGFIIDFIYSLIWR